MLIAWGFRPQVIVYIPNVRGVVTGVPEPAGQGPQWNGSIQAPGRAHPEVTATAGGS